jgi:hypothetical protein
LNNSAGGLGKNEIYITVPQMDTLISVIPRGVDAELAALARVYVVDLQVTWGLYVHRVFSKDVRNFLLITRTSRYAY